MTDLDELKDALFDTTLALEEMIVYYEGKLPSRFLDLQRASGYVDARKAVLNEARTQLRRTKTSLLRLGVLKARAPQAAPGERVQGWTSSTLEKGQDSPVETPPAQIESQAPRKRGWGAWLCAAVSLGCFAVGFWWPWVHASMAWAVAIAAAALPLYFRVVGVRE